MNNKKKFFIAFFIAVQLFLIFFHIHKRSIFIKLSYEKQKYEKQKEQLLERKQQLRQELAAVQDLQTIKKNALTELKMQKIALDQIKALPYESTH
jgi:cell division protein FtsL